MQLKHKETPYRKSQHLFIENKTFNKDVKRHHRIEMASFERAFLLDRSLPIIFKDNINNIPNNMRNLIYVLTLLLPLAKLNYAFSQSAKENSYKYWIALQDKYTQKPLSNAKIYFYENGFRNPLGVVQTSLDGVATIGQNDIFEDQQKKLPTYLNLFIVPKGYFPTQNAMAEGREIIKMEKSFISYDVGHLAHGELHRSYPYSVFQEMIRMYSVLDTTVKNNIFKQISDSKLIRINDGRSAIDFGLGKLEFSDKISLKIGHPKTIKVTYIPSLSVRQQSMDNLFLRVIFIPGNDFSKTLSIVSSDSSSEKKIDYLNKSYWNWTLTANKEYQDIRDLQVQLIYKENPKDSLTFTASHPIREEISIGTEEPESQFNTYFNKYEKVISWTTGTIGAIVSYIIGIAVAKRKSKDEASRVNELHDLQVEKLQSEIRKLKNQK